VTSMRTMFYNAFAFARGIGDWDTSSVTDSSWMFHSTAQGYVWTTIFVRDSYSSQNDGPPSAWSLKPGLCGENYYVSDGACVPCAAGTVNPPGDSFYGGDTTCAFDDRYRYCAEDHRVSSGTCAACAGGLARPAGDDVLQGDTTCGPFCAADHRVSRGACLPCSEGNVRAAGDDPSGGDTACTCSCKDRFRGNGMKLKDLAFFGRSSRLRGGGEPSRFADPGRFAEYAR